MKKVNLQIYYQYGNFCLKPTIFYDQIQIKMKLISVVVVATIIVLSTAIPWKSQIALLNSLEVGRKEDPMTWSCVGCEEFNKPLSSSIIQDNKKDVKSILSVYPEYTVLAFRYTATLKNFFQDILWAFQVQDEEAPAGCKVQRQFDRMWNAIRPEVLKGLKERSHTGRLIITGISLGGGLSCLSYVDIAKTGIFQNIEIITFGAPRVGNKKWAAWFDSTTPSTRYFIKGDPISVLPRCLTPICNYRQTGTPIVCNKRLQECRVKLTSQEMTTTEYFQSLNDVIAEHSSEEQEVDGILDHIYGYKKIRDYTQID